MAGTTTNGVTTYPIEVQIEDTEGLLPGMNVSTEIIVNQVEDVVAIPVGAVVRGDKVLVKTGNTSTCLLYTSFSELGNKAARFYTIHFFLRSC